VTFFVLMFGELKWFGKKIVFPTSVMKMILSALNLVRKIGVCITSEENGENKLTSEENLFNNLIL
jgi:hypothetical protein